MEELLTKWSKDLHDWATIVEARLNTHMIGTQQVWETIWYKSQYNKDKDVSS
jgi:hypothetical protein